MENSTKKSGGVEVPKRNRSSDLKSLYESRAFRVGKSEKKIFDKDDEEDVKKKKRKGIKEVSLSCFESNSKKSKRVDVSGLIPDVDCGPKLSGENKVLHGISLALGVGSEIKIPKRRRGSRGVRVESDHVSQSLGVTNSVDPKRALNPQVSKCEDADDADDQLIPLVTISGDNDGVSNLKSTAKIRGSNSKSRPKSDSKSTLNSTSTTGKLKRKAEIDLLKESRNDQSGSVLHAVRECNPVLNNGDASSEKTRNNNSRKQDSISGREGHESSTKKSELSVGSSVSDSLGIDVPDNDDEDEKNLEQNAARMLSSRFDPSCTGFSSSMKFPASQTVNESSFPVLCTRESFNQEAKLLGGRMSASASNKSRSLRPRREEKDKGLSRKRRHFYEVPPRDIDAYWFLKRRIKIFWPLDDSWYYGFVNDYHSESKLHHIKYDDQDEEWIDLQQEKFKLLLLRSEVPGNEKSKKQTKRETDLQVEQRFPAADDDRHLGNYLDSAPMASWLASSFECAKSFPESFKGRTSQIELSSVHSSSSEKIDSSNSNMAGSKRTRNMSDSESASVDDLVSGNVGIACRGTASSSQNGKHVVYVRKKYNKKCGGGNPVCSDVKACGSDLFNVTPLAPVMDDSLATRMGEYYCGCVDIGEQLWSIDKNGDLRLNVQLVVSKEFRLQLCMPILPFWEFSHLTGDFQLLHDLLMLQHGVVVTTSSNVILEMLFVDGTIGLRFLIFEGFLKQALAFVFLILAAFSESDENWNGGMKLPVMSIRFRISSVLLRRKQHVFSFYTFSSLHSSQWVYLDSEVLQHCLVIKQLPVPECTYDNIKELEYGSFHQSKPHVGLGFSLNKSFERKFLPSILPMDVSRGAYNTRMSGPALILAVKSGVFPHFTLSFSAAPTFFFSLHLQLLMEHSFASVNLQHQEALCSEESSVKDGQPVADPVQFELRSVAAHDVSAEHEIVTLEKEDPTFRGLSSSEGMDVILASNIIEKVDSCEKLQKPCPDDARESKEEVHEKIIVSEPPFVPISITSQTSNPKSGSTFGSIILDVPSFKQVDIPFDGKGCIAGQIANVCSNGYDGFARSTNTTISQTSLQYVRSSSISCPLGHDSHVWPDGKPSFMPNGFGNGPRKPRTQVQYMLPFVGSDVDAMQKMQNHKPPPCKRIRRASSKRMPEGSSNNQRNLDLLHCVANILVTHGDKGWRECGAHIILEVADHNEWRLAVKLSGVTKYSCEVKNILQPGSTNRFSHAMMWKGGKDWVLEFPDRSQWMLFKEMHEECYNRNVRAASVKSIPIPGVRLIEESDYYRNEVPFGRNPTKYFRQIQTDVEMAMDPAHILYDMDSDDEKWLVANKNGTDKHKCGGISEEILEKTLDIFEKVSYVRTRDSFTNAEIEELVVGIGSVETAKVIYEYWRQKREKKATPLIRHLQPPLWQRYEHQLKEWEHNVARGSCPSSGGCQQKVSPEKPPMFAFCLKPRGLDVPNKGSKQRSHRRFPVPGHHLASSYDHDSRFAFGKRSNAHAYGDAESSDVSPSLRASTRRLSPRDMPFSLSTVVSEWNRIPKFYNSKSKKLVSHPQMMPYSQRTKGNRNGLQQQNMDLPELSSKRQYYFDEPHRPWVDRLNGSDLHEFQLRDAAAAAKYAHKVAKLKRENAQRLFYKADLAVQKAAAALMIAEAIKDSCEKLNGIKLK